nr:hypothetical protein GCM10020093_065970 [Planobispora longispora]
MVALLDHHAIELSGRHAAVVGRSTVVGKPAAHLLLDRNATVTVCHSRTADLAAVTSAADIVVAAVGRAGLITAEHVRPGAVVVDVGTNPTAEGGLVGDVDAGSVRGRAGALTPVPGGVGPVTTALLLRHTVRAAARTGEPPPGSGERGPADRRERVPDRPVRPEPSGGAEGGAGPAAVGEPADGRAVREGDPLVLGEALDDLHVLVAPDARLHAPLPAAGTVHAAARGGDLTGVGGRGRRGGTARGRRTGRAARGRGRAGGEAARLPGGAR